MWYDIIARRLLVSFHYVRSYDLLTILLHFANGVECTLLVIITATFEMRLYTDVSSLVRLQQFNILHYNVHNEEVWISKPMAFCMQKGLKHLYKLRTIRGVLISP